MSPLVVAHALCGAIALGSMAVPLAARKGGRAHVLGGRVYVAAMVGVVSLALAVCARRLAADPADDAATFLGLIGVLAGHSTFQGWRLARRRLEPAPVDGAVGAAVGLLGVVAVLGSGGSPLWIAFGALTAFTGGLAARDGLRGFPSGKARIRAHLASMIAAGISTVSAFLVVNLHHLPEAVVGLLPPVAWWLLPTVLGVPAIFWFGRRYAEPG